MTEVVHRAMWCIECGAMPDTVITVERTGVLGHYGACFAHIEAVARRVRADAERALGAERAQLDEAHYPAGVRDAIEAVHEVRMHELTGRTRAERAIDRWTSNAALGLDLDEEVVGWCMCAHVEGDHMDLDGGCAITGCECQTFTLDHEGRA